MWLIFLPAVHCATAAVAAKTARAAVSQAPAKSMRQLNKENDDLQLRVEELAQSLYTVQAGKQAVKAAFEVGASSLEAESACATKCIDMA